MKKTAYAVILFIIVLIAAGYSMKSNADEGGLRISVGQSVINSSLKVGEVGYEYNDWEFSAALMEEGDTKNGSQDLLQMYSVSYLTKPDWGYKGIDPYLRIGAAYIPESNLVGNTNFRLGVGIDFHNIWRVEYSHYSSAGIHQTNTGIDYLTITYQIPHLW